jgi:Transposase DDE domain
MPWREGASQTPPPVLFAGSDVTKHGTIVYRASKLDCDACAFKSQCCPNMPARKIARSAHEAARHKARAIAKTEAYAVSRRERKKVEMLFAHLKRILRLDRLRLRGPNGAKDEFLLAATAQNPEAGEAHFRRPPSPHEAQRPNLTSQTTPANACRDRSRSGFFNKIGRRRSSLGAARNVSEGPIAPVPGAGAVDGRNAPSIWAATLGISADCALKARRTVTGGRLSANAGSPAKISQRVSVASTIVIESKIRVFQHNPWNSGHSKTHG